VSIIEQAARRLEELRRAGIEAAPSPRVQPSRPGTNDFPPNLADLGRPPAAMRSVQLLRPGAADEGESALRVILDPARLAAAGIAAPGAPRSRLADQFRGIKRPLLMNARGESAAPVKRANCIMVTSAVPGEGKTFAALNLAMSLAMEVDWRVLLIDADVLRPAVFDRLGLPPAKGLLDALADPELPLRELILPTSIDKLSLLPAGTAGGHTTELLGSAAMARLVEQLATQDERRILLFDSPPLLAAPETRVLAGHVGQIVVVVEAQRTPRNSVVEALATIEACPVVMTLLNKVRGVEGKSYGYGYGYGYGSS
jgi:protein-tyrosine kinase